MNEDQLQFNQAMIDNQKQIMEFAEELRLANKSTLNVLKVLNLKVAALEEKVHSLEFPLQ